MFVKEVVRVYISNERLLLNGKYLNKSELDSFLEEKNYVTILKKHKIQK